MLVLPAAIRTPGGVTFAVSECLFAGEVRVNFSSMLETATFGLSVIYILTPHLERTAYRECVECKQASS